MTAHADLLRAVAAHGLDTTLVLPAASLRDDAWPGFIDGVAGARLGGLLADAVSTGGFPVTPTQHEAVAALHESEMRKALHLEATLLQVVALLREEGIETRVLKGLAVAHLDFADPSLRCFGDVDLLVRSSDIDRAVASLRRVGERDLPERHHGFDRRFGKDATVTVTVDGELSQVDVHRTLALGPFGLAVRLEDLWGRFEALTVGGVVLRALAAEERFLHACYNALLGDALPRLVALRDVAQIASCRALDLGRITATARRWAGEAVVADAVRLARRTLGLHGDDRLASWAAGVRPTRATRLALRAYSSNGGSNTVTLLSGVLGLRHVGDKLAYLRALMFPRPEYVRARRAAGRASEWRTGLRELHAGRRRA